MTRLATIIEEPISSGSSLAGAIVSQFNRSAYSEAACREMIGRILKPAPICPICKVSLTYHEITEMYAGKNLICKHCRSKYSLRTGTSINGIHCDYRDIVLIATMHHWGVSLTTIAQAAGISTATVRRLVERFTALPSTNASDTL